jgi:hypothetical protein
MLCNVMIHNWGRPKQWQNEKGLVISPRCGRCGALKVHEPVLIQAPREIREDDEDAETTQR